MKRKVKKRWQPQIRAEAKAKAASTGGIVIDPAPAWATSPRSGSTDEARFTDIEHLELDL
ncbi:hypothetical protein GTW52_04350 [Streptomyces sp. SID8358]|nr:hypothetical protein [Streptomyces sp. SID8358]